MSACPGKVLYKDRKVRLRNRITIAAIDLCTVESEIEGLKLGPSLQNLEPAWQIGECVARWWRPNFKTYMYSYCPPHITKSKECRVLYMVHLSDRGYFEVPGDLALLAVPMFQLCDNVQKYGSINSSIPQQLSRFEFRMINN
ncbi:hypothetical protein HN51_054576 [Arachis hypogaea]|uniref:Pre-mRNA cleavage factor Im 25 kDa subunit n=1 Tax=Arachis hypogaea TaxID=3818 RepID=A0A6B9V6X2_ARAHY|nr:pre-mRNA cleavage factor Im 25 kDa subunit 2-like isoform X2 [Arachis ipaensis]XP_025679334.1 pre-mRNA cleavage factor Im 25 kDa subunit 2-like [Arachis hypogaea]QHN77160.1 Pre-mRNA cleavage factor Im 25 kDa subunit [Arachis hypogaea]